jgi:hypothetical protein
MGICNSEFNKLYAINPSAEILFRNAYQEISGIALSLQGRRGGLGPRRNDIIWYKVFSNIETIRSERMPRFFFLEPKDAEIEHKNIFHPAPCPELSVPLPHLCWGEYEKYWREELQPHNRTLVCLVRCAEEILRNQCLKPPLAR